MLKSEIGMIIYMHATGVVVTEEAIRLKEKKIATEIIAVSIGGKACQESLRTALAMGADRGIHIETNSRTDQEVQPLAVAKTLKFLAEVRTHIVLTICQRTNQCLPDCFPTEREGGLGDRRQAVHRCRQLPDWPDARGPAELAPVHLRRQVRRGRRQEGTKN